jgi:hypothetical protein
MLKSKGKTFMVEELSHVKQLSPNQVCKIGLRLHHVILTEHNPQLAGEGAARRGR